MKETGIIMSGNHPKLILDGIKTMTRRVIKPQPIEVVPVPRYDPYEIFYDWDYKGNQHTFESYKALVKWMPQYCPYGQVGDRLWVRETWNLSPFDDMPADSFQIIYRASPLGGEILTDFHDKVGVSFDIDKWHSPIFMPRWASRITLEITDIRVERVQEITEEDAKAEGAEYGEAISIYPDTKKYERWEGYRAGFIELWNSPNAKRGYGWEVNPWVWCISFKVVKCLV